MSSRDKWLARLRERGALIEGHFRLSSGLHSPHYVQCAKLLQHPGEASDAAAALVDRLGHELARSPTAVASPAIGGIVLGHEVARALGVRAVWAERDPASGELVFRRGFELAPEEPVIAVEDVVTTGGSLRELVDLVTASGACAVGVATLVDRSGGASNWEMPSASLVQIEGVQYSPESCPLCSEGAPLVKPGSRPENSF